MLSTEGAILDAVIIVVYRGLGGPTPIKAARRNSKPPFCYGRLLVVVVVNAFFFILVMRKKKMMAKLMMMMISIILYTIMV